MNTINTLASELGIKPESLQRRLKRNNIGAFSLEEPLDPHVVDLILKRGEQAPGGSLQERKPAPEKKSIKTYRRSHSIESIIQLLPLPMLGLAASYGVYYFASQFVPIWVAISEAAAFELTYIGLASMKGLSEKQQKRARKVSWGAVLVSVLYNTLTGALHMQPELLQELSTFFFWAVAILHGAPLAILAYLVSNLIFHQKK